jgi:hypothetical protein
VFTLVHEKVGYVEFDNMQGTNNIKMQVKCIAIHFLMVLEPTFIYIRQDIPVTAYAIGEQLLTSLKAGYY